MSDNFAVPADPAGLDLQFRVAASMLDEFVLSHAPGDVFRELVQNEYDAGGTELLISLGEDSLVVRGNGKTIDAAGWKRLSVMLGHGQISGVADRVEQKVNGIGSKNFGLRSLFLFGDRIHVVSGGRRTILDRTQGAPPAPLAHPESRGQPGATLAVPYRQADEGRLQAFDVRHEAEALDAIAAELAPTLIKLAHPGQGKNLQAVVLRSVRLDRELRWRQSARADKSVPGLIRRSARLEENGSLADGTRQVITETEYQRTIVPPDGLLWPDVPGYFRVPGGRVRIGVSLRTRRGRIEVDAPGIFYYPIGAIRSRTGFAFSVSAPFQMNENRDQLVDPHNSAWNKWLIGQVAAFAVGLLPQRLFASFGADAFRAFDPGIRSPTVPALDDEVGRLLRTEPCWPTQATAGRAKRPEYAAVGSLIVPVSPALAEFTADTIAKQDLLHHRLATGKDTRAMTVAAGAKEFTVNSLVRLRCASEDGQDLATTPEETGEASYYFTDFPGQLQDLVLQRRFAVALDASRSELTPAHKRDLRTSPATLTARGTLAAPAGLWVVGEALAGAVPADQLLHPGLVNFKTLSGLCRRFNFSAWASDTAQRMTEGAASDEEQEALGRYIRGKPDLSEKAWAVLRRSPILQDHRGNWTAPQEMVSRKARGATLLEPVLHFPAPTDEQNQELAARLRFRRDLRGSDLVEMARQTEQGHVPSADMARAVGRLKKLLTRSVMDRLKDIKFLDTGDGTLTAPPDAYVRSDRLAAVLGDSAPYADGMPASLLQRLGCMTEPRADDILARLAALRESGAPVARPDVVYRALTVALRRERRPVGELRDQPVLWTGDRWETPGNCLVGADNRSTFLAAVTVLPDALHDEWRFLGVPRQPAEAHWICLLARVGERYGAGQRIPVKTAGSLRRAYRHLEALPADIDPTMPCLLDDQRRLHAPAEAAAGTFVINDDPALASATVSAAVPLAFAETDHEHLTGFLMAAGVRKLSAEATLEGTEYGHETESGPAPSPDQTLSRLHDPNFASALAALAGVLCDPEPSRTAGRLAAQLARITRIRTVDGIRNRYHVAGHDVTVSVPWDLSDGQLTINQIASVRELRRSAASAVASIVDPRRGEQRLGDPVYFLLRCRSAAEMERELAWRKIPWKPLPAPGTDDAVEAEAYDEESGSVTDALAETLRRSILRPSPRPGTSTASPGQTRAAAPVPTPRAPLPDLGLVRPRVVHGAPPPLRREPSSGGRGGYGGTWAPRSPQESEDDRVVGRRGEEIVLALERQRVEQRGLDPARVTWTADSAPASDHDIKSVDDDGGDLWIEVKSTTGRDGQFTWPAAEFRLAVRTRSRYVLYRVYEADTTAPSCRMIRDPVGSFDAGELRLDLDSLKGDVGSMGEIPDSA